MSDDYEPLQVPNNPAAERALIGSLMIDPEAIKDLSITGEDFYLVSHRWIFEAMLTIRREGRAVDYVTLCNQLQSSKQLVDVGGPAAIGKFLSECPSSLHVKSYAEIVKTLARRRKVARECEVLVNAAYNLESDIDGAIGTAMDHLARVNSLRAGAIPISDVVSEVYDQTEKAAANPSEMYGTPTGFADWDELTHGLQPGTVVKITGEPGIGKSLLAVQVLAQAAEHGHAGALYELEMRRQNVVRRLLSAASKIPTYRMQSGKIADDEWPSFCASVEKLIALPVYIEANSQLTTQDIRSDLYRLKLQHDIKVAVIDYESLLQDTQAGANENTLSMVRSSRIHSIAMDLDICVVSLDDMVKEGITGTRNGQAVVSGSARKLHDADEIIVMRRDESNTRLVRLTWEKNREGAAKRFVTLYQQAGYPAFNSYQPKG